MDIPHMVVYLASLVTLIEYHTNLGNSVPNKWIVAEYNEVNAKLLEMLKDKHDETRKSES